LACSATAVTKTTLGIIQLLFKYFTASFLKHLTTQMLIMSNFPKSIVGCTKGPHKPHAVHVFETLGLQLTNPCYVEFNAKNRSWCLEGRDWSKWWYEAKW